MTKLPISAFIICKDEEGVIENCIRSVDFCSEIVVVDSGSTDRTLEILADLQRQGFPIRLIEEPWRGFALQKQFALDHCTAEWCLSIDADERVSPRLRARMAELIADPAVNGWRLTRFDYLIGYGYAPPGVQDHFHERLFRRGKGALRQGDAVHEQIIVEGRVEKAVPGGLLHFTPLPIEQQMQKENRYSSLKAGMKHQRGAKPRPWKMLFSPPHYFLRIYLWRGQWRCGWPGVIQAMNAAVYAYLTEAKRYELAAAERVPPIEPPLPPEY